MKGQFAKQLVGLKRLNTGNYWDAAGLQRRSSHREMQLQKDIWRGKDTVRGKHSRICLSFCL